MSREQDRYSKQSPYVMAGYKANSDASTCSEAPSDGMRYRFAESSRSLESQSGMGKFGFGFQKQPSTAASPVFSMSNYFNESRQEEDSIKGSFFPQNSFLAAGNKDCQIVRPSSALSEQSNGSRKYEFKSKFDEYKQKSTGSGPIVVPVPSNAGGMMFDRRGSNQSAGVSKSNISSCSGDYRPDSAFDHFNNGLPGPKMEQQQQQETSSIFSDSTKNNSLDFSKSFARLGSKTSSTNVMQDRSFLNTSNIGIAQNNSLQGLQPQYRQSRSSTISEGNVTSNSMNTLPEQKSYRPFIPSVSQPRRVSAEYSEKDPNQSLQISRFHQISLGESRAQSNGPVPNGLPRPPKYPNGSAQKQQGYEASQNLASATSKVNNILNKNSMVIPLDILSHDSDYFPQYTMFLLAEEEKNISKYRERVEKEKEKVNRDFEQMKNEMNNLIDDLKMEMNSGVDEHFKLFIDQYAQFKKEVIDFKSVKTELPSINAPSIQNFDGNNGSSNVQLIKELEELRYRNHMSKLYNYVAEIQKANVNRVIQTSQALLSQMSSGASLYNVDACQNNLKEIKNQFAMNLSQKFDPMSQYIRSVCYQQNPASSNLEQEAIIFNDMKHCESGFLANQNNFGANQQLSQAAFVQAPQFSLQSPSLMNQHFNFPNESFDRANQAQQQQQQLFMQQLSQGQARVNLNNMSGIIPNEMNVVNLPSFAPMLNTKQESQQSQSENHHQYSMPFPLTTNEEQNQTSFTQPHHGSSQQSSNYFENQKYMSHEQIHQTPSTQPMLNPMYYSPFSVQNCPQD